MSTQRVFKKKGKLPADKIQQLDEVGFVWDLRESQWDTRFKELLAYKSAHGNVSVPRGGFNELANWINKQREVYKNGKISAERVQRLEEIGFEWER
jgi:hypothetical protein